MFPFVKKVVRLNKYANREKLWKYDRLECGIDPIDIIIADWDQGKYDPMKVAMLKELARAAYEGPARYDDPIEELLDNDKKRERAERLAAAELRERVGTAVSECPVCGAKALVQYDDYMIDYEADGSPVYGPSFPYRFRCASCSLDINYVDNPSNYGLPIPPL